MRSIVLSLLKNRTWVVGFLLGVACSLFGYIATLLTRPNPSFDGMALVVGFSYILASGIWIGSRQGGRRTILGASVGLACGFVYILLASHDYFVRSVIGGLGIFGTEITTLFVTYPAILSGVMAAVLGTSNSWTVKLSLIRYGKGALAGFVLGFLHFVLALVFLGAGAALRRMVGEYNPSSFPCVEAALGLGCASAFYLPMISWAVGLPSDNRSVAWVAKLTVWRVGIVLFILMTIAGMVFSNGLPR